MFSKWFCDRYTPTIKSKVISIVILQVMKTLVMWLPDPSLPCKVSESSKAPHGFVLMTSLLPQWHPSCCTSSWSQLKSLYCYYWGYALSQHLGLWHECSVLLLWRCHSQSRWTGARVCPEVTWRPTLQLCATLQGLPRTFCLSFLLICCKNFIRKRERENKQLLTTVQAFKDTAFDPKCNSCF